MTPELTRWTLGCALLSMAALASCTHTVKVEPIKVEPIDITLHIYLEADEKLESFFDFQDQPPAPPPSSPATNPSPTEGASP
jgi:hypothetical protein